MPLIAKRGGSALSEDELKGHLAALLRLENIGVLLGAGASVNAGGQTVASLWSSFVDTYPNSAQVLLVNNFVREEHLAPEPARLPPDVEALGDAIEIAALEWERAGRDVGETQQLKSAIADLKRSVVKAAILNEEWWKNPSQSALAVELDSHKSLLQKLVGARQPGQSSPWLFTTNYDLAVEWSAEAIDLQVANGFLGLHNRRFSPQSFDLGLRNTLARGEARFGIYNIYLAKLHGSLTWKEQDGEIAESSANAEWAQLEAFLGGADETSKMMVFPRAAKYIQTVGFALGELLRRFSEFLVRPQTALFIAGYGFGDDHLNRILLSALQNPTLQVVIYLPEVDFDNPVNNRKAVRSLLSLCSPRITIVGGRPESYFSAFVAHLPDPIVYDEAAKRIRDLLREEAPREDVQFERADRQ